MIARPLYGSAAMTARRRSTSQTWPLTLSASGTGAGVAKMRLYASSATTVTLDGAGYFYSDSAGTQNQAQSWPVSVGLNTLYIKVASGTSNLVFASRAAIARWCDPWHTLDGGGWVTPTNAPALSANLSTFPALTEWSVQGVSAFSGDWGALNGSLTYVSLSGSVTSTMTGTKSGPVGTTVINGTITPSSTLYVDVSSMSSLQSCMVTTGWVLQGSVSALSSCTRLGSFGTFNCSGSLSALSSLTYLYATSGSSSLTYPTTSGTRTWPSGMDQIYLRTQTLATASIDALLIDLAAQSSWTGNKIVNLKGTRSSASDTAYSTLLGRGVSVNIGT